MLAHAGGWDELLIAVGAVLVVVLPRVIMERRRRSREAAPTDGPCLYCGAALEPGAARCATCGFKTHRANSAADAPPADA